MGHTPAPGEPRGTIPATPDPHLLAEAALANADIRFYRGDPELGRVWTEEAIRRCPTCRNEWEHATVIATRGEAQAAVRHKNWGAFLGVFPLARDDPVHPYRILYVYKPTSPYNRRVEQRRELKRLLGKAHRSLVARASRSTKGDFLKVLTRDQARVIHRRLHLDPGRFWRVAKGREFVDLPKRPVQPSLFDPEEPDPPTPLPQQETPS
jgi:hypothetical protein